MEPFKYPDEYTELDDYNPSKGTHFTQDAINYQASLPQNSKLPDNSANKATFQETELTLDEQLDIVNNPELEQFAPVLGVDAFRHILWQATITMRRDASVAKAFGDAHEVAGESYTPNTYASHNMDFNNNRYARILAEQAKKEGKTLHDLPKMIEEAIKQNREVTDEDGNKYRPITKPWQAWRDGQIAPEMRHFADLPSTGSGTTNVLKVRISEKRILPSSKNKAIEHAGKTLQQGNPSHTGAQPAPTTPRKPSGDTGIHPADKPSGQPTIPTYKPTYKKVRRPNLVYLRGWGYIQKGYVWVNVPVQPIAGLGTTAFIGAPPAQQPVIFWEKLSTGIIVTPNYGNNVVKPLVIDLDGDGIETISAEDSKALFDYKGNGFAEKTSWVAKDDGILVVDLNENNIIDNSDELFGTVDRTGFQDLSSFDTNGDKLIDANDADFGKLKIWQDANEDGITDAGELKTLAERNIKSISLNSEQMNEMNNGNWILEKATFTKTDNSTGTVYDATFAVSPEYTAQTAPYEIDTDLLAMPWLRGYGQTRDLLVEATAA